VDFVKEFVVIVKRERCKKEKKNLVYPNLIDFSDPKPGQLGKCNFFSNPNKIDTFQ